MKATRVLGRQALRRHAPRAFSALVVLFGLYVFLVRLAPPTQHDRAGFHALNGPVSVRWEARHAASGHESAVPTALALSADSRSTFVSGATDAIAYDTATGKVLWTQSNPAPVTGIAAPPAGTLVVLGGRDRVWALNARTGKEAWSAVYPGSPVEVAAGERFVAVTGPTAGAVIITALYDLATGYLRWQAVFPGNGGDAAAALALNPDETKVVVTGETGSSGQQPRGILTVAYNTADGTQSWMAVHHGPGRGAGDRGRALAVAPDGATVYATGASPLDDRSGALGYATLAYDLTTGAELWAARYDGPGGTNAPASVAVSGDGSKVAVTGRSRDRSDDYATVCYDAHDGHALWTTRYDGPAHGREDARLVAFSSDNDFVYVSGSSQGEGSDFDYATVAYDARTGDLRWAARYDGPANRADLVSQMAVAHTESQVIVLGASRNEQATDDYLTVAYRLYNQHLPAPKWVDFHGLAPLNQSFAVQTATTDPDGHAVKYCVDWGDGTDLTCGLLQASGTPWIANHTYRFAGTFRSRAQATDSRGSVSVWSDPATVTVEIVRPAPALVTPAAGTALHWQTALAATVGSSSYPVAKVEFWGERSGDKQLLGTTTATNTDGRYAAAWQTMVDCNHEGAWTVWAVAHDEQGNTGSSVPVSVTVDNVTFSDVGCRHWAWRPIEAVARSGIATGFTGGTYQPNFIVNRAQMAVFVARASDKIAGGLANFTPPPCGSETFADVRCDHWAYTYIEYLVSKKITSGYATGLYQPDKEMGRDEMAIFLARIADLRGHDYAAFAPPRCGQETFRDVHCDFWTYKPIEYLVRHGVISGSDGRTFEPLQQVTRLQMAAFLAPAVNLPE